jgi:DNA-binding transcriptional LysR family regulator
MRLPIDKTYLDGLVTFVTVAEQRGFRAAARIMGVTPSAISQSIRALELRVGAPLFFRTTRNVNLTEAGEHLLTHVRPAMELLTAGLNGKCQRIPAYACPARSANVRHIDDHAGSRQWESS